MSIHEDGGVNIGGTKVDHMPTDYARKLAQILTDMDRFENEGDPKADVFTYKAEELDHKEGMSVIKVFDKEGYKVGVWGNGQPDLDKMAAKVYAESHNIAQPTYFAVYDMTSGDKTLFGVYEDKEQAISIADSIRKGSEHGRAAAKVVIANEKTVEDAKFHGLMKSRTGVSKLSTMMENDNKKQLMHITNDDNGNQVYQEVGTERYYVMCDGELYEAADDVWFEPLSKVTLPYEVVGSNFDE